MNQRRHNRIPRPPMESDDDPILNVVLSIAAALAVMIGALIAWMTW